MKRPAIKDRAHRHMREAAAFGWQSQSRIEDHAIAALIAEGVEERIAARHVRRVWNEHFAIAGAV